jgi:microcystin-dependent protein
MALVRARARIVERSITSGGTPWALAGAVDDSYNTFSAFMADGDRTYASIVEPGVAFATGVVTYDAGSNSLALTEVEEVKGTFGAGTKEIMAGSLASKDMFAEDISGAIVTGGTSTAYSVSSHSLYETLGDLNGKMIAFTPHTSNGANGTSLNVDLLGPKPILSSPGVGLQAGVLIQGTPYGAIYNNTDGAFYLHSFFGNPFNVPLFGGMDFWDTIAPNSCFIFPVGQAISRTTYAAAFARWGVHYGVGDGSTTFNVPNKMGKVSAMIEASASLLTPTFFGSDSTQLGAAGGLESHTLTVNETAAHFHSANITDTGHVHSTDIATNRTTAALVTPGGSTEFWTGETPVNTGSSATGVRVSSDHGLDTTFSTGGGAAHNNVQPTITCNYIIRII